MTWRTLPGSWFNLWPVAVAVLMLGSPVSAQVGSARGGAYSSQPVSKSHAPATTVSLKIKLPFPAGASYPVIQGNHGTFTHSGFNEYGWDFGMPENSPVAAAAAGRVVRVKQDGASGGPSHEYFSQGNTVIIDHGHGYYTQYLHLAQNSARVREGDLVAAGDIIALSGNTGYSSMPHLHFQVQDATGQSLPVVFQDVPGGIPQVKSTVTSHNDGRGTSQYAGESRLPPDVFRLNGVVLITRTLPGHLFRSFQRYPVKGRLLGSEASQRVAIYFMASDGGRPLQVTYAKTDKDGFFDAMIEPGKIRTEQQGIEAGLDNSRTKPADKENSGKSAPESAIDARTQSQMYSLAIAPVNPDGTFWSDISVPVCVR